MNTTPTSAAPGSEWPAWFEWAGLSDRGLVRTNNEDAFAVATLTDAARPAAQPEAGRQDSWAAAGCVFVVSDGVGGANAGEVASGIAVEVVPAALASLGLRPAELTNRACGRHLESAIRAANGRVRQEAAGDPRRSGMAATLSVFWLVGYRAILGQVGDSRIYRYRAGRLVQLTHDQSEVGRMVRSGRLTDAEAKNFRGRNIIDQSLGTAEEQLLPEIDWVEVLPGDVFLLCSDGLVDRLEDRHLAEILEKCGRENRPLAETAAELVDHSNRASGRDNTTVLLVRVAPAEAIAPPPLSSSTPALGMAAAAASVPPQAQPAARFPAGGNATRLMAAAFAGVLLGVLGLWLFVHRPRVELATRNQAEQTTRATRLEQELALESRHAAAAIARHEATIGELQVEQARLLKELELARVMAGERERILAQAQDEARSSAAQVQQLRQNEARLEQSLATARKRSEQLQAERNEAWQRAEAAERAVLAAAEAAAAQAAAQAAGNPGPAPAPVDPAAPRSTPAGP